MDFKKGLSAVVIAAHPDDEVLGTGAVIAKMADKLMDVYVIFIATGISSRYSDFNLNKDKIEDEILILREQSKQAAQLLGVKETFLLNFPDNKLDTVSRMDITRKIKSYLDKIKPNILFIHHPGDYNWDHKIAYDASMMAARANPGDYFPDYIYSYEVLSSTERAAQEPHTVFCPTAYVNIDSTIEKKKKAIEIYKSELRAYPHPRSPEAVEMLALKRGNEVGIAFAEAFHLIREIKP
ncbi:PIG-L family deacetylase [bacterium]|nr:PIG-L family deacetylase [bacterium]